MRKEFPALLVSAMLLLFAGSWAGGQEKEKVESRSFTNKDGKVIEAVLLEVKDQNAWIRRESDGRNFEIPIGTLSLEDQIWIVDWTRQSSRTAEGEWAGLEVTFPNPMDSCGIVGLAATCAAEKVADSEFDLLLPEGAWVKVAVYSQGNGTQPLEHLVQFRGAKRWVFSTEGPNLSLSRDGGPPEIVGISFPSTVTEEWLRELNERRFAEQVSVEVYSTIDFGQIDWRRTEIVACTSVAVADAEFLGKIATVAPKAIDLTVSPDGLGPLAQFPDLEAMAILVTIPPPKKVPDSDDESVGEKMKVDDLALAGLPAVRDLSLSGLPFSPELEAALAEKGTLRMFDFTISSRSSTYREPAQWESLGSLADSLESIHIERGIWFDFDDLKKITGLRALTLAADTLGTAQLGTLVPSAFPEILSLNIVSPAVAAEVWEEWAKHGMLGKLKRLSAFQVFDVTKSPDLEMAWFSGTTPIALDLDLRDLHRAEKLRKLSINGLDQGDIEDLDQLAGGDRIEALRLGYCTASDLSPLSELPNLKFLELFQCEECPTEIDLGIFPNLTGFNASYQAKLETVSGVAAHPTLRSLMVSYCDAFRNLGPAEPNEVLRYLYLYRCRALEDLSAFDRTTGLTQMRLYDCDLIAEPPAFLQKNSWVYLRVSGCENLPSLTAATVSTIGQ